jgi:4-amino-4-deoxy-L-arabinose transferase-like glycosyltransferase
VAEPQPRSLSLASPVVAPPRATWRTAGIALGLAVLVGLPGLLWPPPLNTAHEARFPLLARDMLERQVWFPAERGVLYRNKPPLFVWGIAGASWLRGAVTVGTALVPVVLGALIGVLFTALLGERLFGPRAGRWAACVLASTYLFFAYARTPVPDMLVVGLGSAAAYAAWQAVSAPTGAAWRLVFAVVLALGVAVKGPVGLLPLLAVAVWLLASQGLRGFGRLWSPAALGLFIVLTLAWLIPYLASGTEGVASEVVGGGLRTYFGAPPLVSLGGQLAQALVGLMPWTVAVPLAVRAAVPARRTPAVGFALAWLVVPAGAVLLSHTQHTRYLLPICPGAALLVAWWADTAASRPDRLARALGALAAVAAAGMVAAPLWARPSPRTFLPGYGPDTAPLYAGLAVLGLVLGTALWHGRPGRLVLGAGSLMLALLLYGGILHARWLEATQDFRGLAARLERHAPGAPVGAAGMPSTLLQLDFYLGRPVTMLAPGTELLQYLGRPERPLAVVDGQAWRELATPPGTALRVLDQVRLAGREVLVVRAGG